jgi:hypothetical protein
MQHRPLRVSIVPTLQAPADRVTVCIVVCCHPLVGGYLHGTRKRKIKASLFALVTPLGVNTPIESFRKVFLHETRPGVPGRS